MSLRLQLEISSHQTHLIAMILTILKISSQPIKQTPECNYIVCVDVIMILDTNICQTPDTDMIWTSDLLASWLPPLQCLLCDILLLTWRQWWYFIIWRIPHTLPGWVWWQWIPLDTPTSLLFLIRFPMATLIQYQHWFIYLIHVKKTNINNHIHEQVVLVLAINHHFIQVTFMESKKIC
jgi:hypothetical protein